MSLSLIYREITNLNSFSRPRYTLGYIHRYSCLLCCYTQHLDDTHWKKNTHLCLKQTSQNQHNYVAHFLPFGENDHKKYKTVYLSMNGRHPYTPDYKSICNPQLYPYIQHFDRTCIFQAHIHQCLYCSRKKNNLYKMGNTCKTLISSVVVVFNQSRLQIESVERVPPICTNS